MSCRRPSPRPETEADRYWLEKADPASDWGRFCALALAFLVLLVVVG